jgi:hypothetical protein
MTKLEKLIAERDQLENQANEMQKEQAASTFKISVDDVKMIKTIIDHLNKGYKWQTKNAAIIVTLYDKLKEEKARLTAELTKAKETGAEVELCVNLKAYELNALYQALLNVEGEGIESARRFVRMLTLVGESVTSAMAELGEANKEVSEIHVKLRDLDVNIAALEKEQTEEVEPTLETAGDATSSKK